MAHSLDCWWPSRHHRSCARVILTACTLTTFTLCALLLLRTPTQASVEAKSVYLLANLDDARLLQRSASYKWHVKRDNEPDAAANRGEQTESKSDQASSEEEKSFAAEDGGGGDSSPSESTSGAGGEVPTGANQQEGAPPAEPSPRALGSPPPQPAVSGPLKPASDAEADALDKFGDDNDDETAVAPEEGEALSGGRQLTEVNAAVGSSTSSLAPSNDNVTTTGNSNAATEQGQSKPSPELLGGLKLEPPSGSLQGKDQLDVGQMVTNVTSVAQNTFEDIAKQMELGGGGGGGGGTGDKQEARSGGANPLGATANMTESAINQAAKQTETQSAAAPPVTETKPPVETAAKEEVTAPEKSKKDDSSSELAATIEQKAQQAIESKSGVAEQSAPETSAATQKAATNDISGSQPPATEVPSPKTQSVTTETPLAQVVTEQPAKQVTTAQENIATPQVAATEAPTPEQPATPQPPPESEEKTEPTPVVSSSPESEVKPEIQEIAPVPAPPVQVDAATSGEKPKESGEEQYRQANPELPEESEGEQSINYKLDHATCPEGGHRGPEVLERAVETILGTLVSDSCGQTKALRNLKLKPLVNKKLAGFVLESSSLPLDPTQFTLAQTTRASCVAPANSAANNSIRFRFEQDFADQYLASRWRLYPRLRQDDLPDEVFKSLATLKSHNHVHRAGPGKSHGSNKCQRFGVESGDFYLELLSLRTSSIYDVELDESTQEATSVQLVDFKVDQLYLDHGLVRLQDSGETQVNNSPGDLLRRHSRQQTRQILHAGNNHFRRNNWLLDLYGNWMRHEYRSQLRHLLNGPALRDHLNSCLADIHHSSSSSLPADGQHDGQQTSGGESQAAAAAAETK